jgi:hypothetical protein
MSSPTSRTLEYLRDNGWDADVVERWIPRAFIRKDLFGIIDIVAMSGAGILGVQATSTANVTARVKKAMAEPRLKKWLSSGGVFHVIGWAKRGRKGEVKRWKPKIVTFMLVGGELTWCCA